MPRRPPSAARRLRSLFLIVAMATVGISTAASGVRADTTLANWGQQSPAQAPAGRAFAAMDYDSIRGRTLLFGGANGSTYFTDTWEWDGTSWSTFSTTVSPPTAIGPGMAYDGARGVSILLDNGGNTWEWNGSSWVRRTTASSPPARVWTSMAYDSARGRTVLFGGDGAGGVDLGDTWTYDGTNWTKMSPASSPSPRFGMAMSFDSARGLVVLFGGRAAGQRVNDTWEWDGTNWTQRTPATVPYARFVHSMAYDAQLGETVMFGGDHIEPYALGPINDTWLWDGTNWTRDWTPAVPISRAGQAMAYDSAAGRIVLFGGTDELNPGIYYNDTLEFGTGIVTPAGNPALAFPSTSLSFGSTSVGTTTAANRLRVIGSGTGPLLISSISTTGDFAVSGTDCPIAPNPLAVGAFCNVQITYTPTVCGTRTGSLIFTDNSAGGSESMSLEGGVLSTGCDGDLELLAQQDVTVNATSPSGAAISYNGIFTADEDGTPPPVTCNPAINSTFPIGSTTVSCQATDSDDVTSTVTATFHVTVSDTDLALSGVPADITVGAAGPAGTVVSYTAPSAVDEDASTPAVSCSPASGSTFPIGTTTVTCGTSDSDDAPNTVTAAFKVTVGDDDLALNGVQADLTIQATFAGGAAVGFVTPNAVDEDASLPAVSCDHTSGSTFPLGTTTVTCQATDADDTPSTVTATFQVTVIDTDLGLGGVPADVTVNAAGPSGAVVTYTSPTGADEDGNAIVVSCDHASGSTFPIGTTALTCSVSDADDTPSTRTATFYVTVNDTDLALAGVPADITVVATGSSGAAVTYTPPSAIDEDASMPSVGCNRASGSTFSVGTTIVFCQVTDADDTPATVTAAFHVTVVPDLQLAISVSPTTATAHTTVTTTTYATNLGTVSRKVTLSYSVTFTDSSGNTSVVASDKAEVTIAPGQTATRSFSFAVKNSTPTGTYQVAVTASDDTGSVSQSGSFSVT
jgi:HYR domain-containing protein